MIVERRTYLSKIVLLFKLYVYVQTKNRYQLFSFNAESKFCCIDNNVPSTTRNNDEDLQINQNYNENIGDNPRTLSVDSRGKIND